MGECIVFSIQKALYKYRFSISTAAVKLLARSQLKTRPRRREASFRFDLSAVRCVEGLDGLAFKKEQGMLASAAGPLFPGSLISKRLLKNFRQLAILACPNGSTRSKRH